MVKVNGEDDELKEHLEYACMAPRVPQGLLESHHWCQQARTPCRKAPSRQLQESLWVEARCGLAMAQVGGTGQAEADRRLWHDAGPLGQGWKKGGEPLPGRHCSCSAFFPPIIHCFWGEGEGVIREKPDPEGRGGSAPTCGVFSWKPQNAHGHWRS